MLKYGKMKVVKKADSPLAVFFAWVQLLLVIVGLVGIAVEFFRDNGWFKKALNAVINTSSSTLIMVLPVGFLVYLVVSSWIQTHDERESSSMIADAMLYVMMMVGVWFVWRFVTEGGF